jgi:hypothetical protein
MKRQDLSILVMTTGRIHDLTLSPNLKARAGKSSGQRIHLGPIMARRILYLPPNETRHIPTRKAYLIFIKKIVILAVSQAQHTMGSWNKRRSKLLPEFLSMHCERNGHIIFART